MKWIRGPAWDISWFLSGPALGLLLMGIFAARFHSQTTQWITFGVLTIMQAHTASPIVLAWSHREFRSVMMESPWKYLGVPIAITGVGLGIALISWWLFPYWTPHKVAIENIHLTDLDVPLIYLINLYAIWNQYHFGAQNFGLFCLYRRRGIGDRRLKWGLLITFVVVSSVIGHLGQLTALPFLAIFMVGLTSGNHWLTSIGLSAHVYSRHRGASPWWFVLVVLVVGLPWAWALQNILYFPTLAIMCILAMRASYGIWHFLQERWIWKFSDTQVRATIGRDIFRPEQEGPFEANYGVAL